MLPVPTIDDLAVFAGQDTDFFGAFANEALAQATLLFSIKTKRVDLPDDPDQAQLATNAILQMAARIYYEQPYVATAASPFQSETIGSYSYSKMLQTVTRYAQKSTADTGLFWWDLALQELTLDDRSLVTSGSVEAIDMDLRCDPNTGRWVLVNAADSYRPDIPFDYNTELNPRPRF